MASQTSDSSFIALRHHDEYHLSGGDLYFLVEQYHFRVHRYFFERESTFFKHQLATPASPGEDRQGTSEGTAIVLDHVTPTEFAKFLWVFYNPKYSLYDATVEDWIIILKLADRWCFPEVKHLAVRQLEKHLMDDIERIVVYQKYNVDRHLLIPRYAALCARTETLSLAEGIRLGMETALNIARARECARSPSVDGMRSPTSVALPSEEMHGIIVDLFSISEASDSASKGQENGSSTASSSTTSGGSVIPSCPYMLPHAHDGILQEMQQPRTPLTETPNQTEKPQTATKTDEIAPVPAVEGDEGTDEDSFEADEDEESWDDVGSDSDTHVDNAGVDSEKIYGDVDDGPVENVVDPQENDEAHDLDEQLHDPAPDAGVGDAPPESSAQDSRDDNDASTSHEIDGGPDHGDGEGDGQDGSSSPSSGEVEKNEEQSTDITADTTSGSAEGKEDDGGTPTGESVSPFNSTVDSSSSVPETLADAGYGLGDEFSFDFVDPSGLGSIPTFDFDSDSTFDHIDIPNITVHSPTASHAGTEAGDESIEASVNTEGRDQAAEGDAKNASASSSSDTVPNASGPEGAMTTEADAGVAEGSGDAAAVGNEDEASNGDVPDHILPPSDETVPKTEDGGSATASGDGSNAPADPPVPESEADEAALKPEEGSSTTAEGNSGNVPVTLTPESSSDEAATEPRPEHDGEQSTVPADADSALQHTADSTNEDAETDVNVPSTADTTTSSSDPATSSSPTLPPQPPVKDSLEGHDTGRPRRPTLSIDTNFSGTFVPTHAGHANGENGDQPADNRPVTSVENPVEPPPIIQTEVPADLNPLGDATNPLPKAAPPEESESEDDANEEFYDSPEGPA